MAAGAQDSAIVNPGSQFIAASLAGIPSSVVLYSQSLDNSIRKEIVYKELDRVPVNVTDTNPLSPNYLRVTYLPDEFKLGKNLIRIRPNVLEFEENSQLYIEIIDYNGDPVYYETEINSETNDLFIIISVYIYEDTPPGPCAVYILGTLKNVTVPPGNQIYPANFRWAQIINIDTSEKTTSPIIFTTLPKLTVTSNTASYDINVYPGGSPYTSSKYYNVSLRNGILNPSITALNVTDTFKPAMIQRGELHVNYDDIQLINPDRFTSNYLLGDGITASIKEYVNNKSITLEDPIVIYQQNSVDQIVLNQAIFRTASIAYEQDPSGILQSSFKKRILSISFLDLDPFVGQIKMIKALYRNTALNSTEFLTLSEIPVLSNGYEGFNPITASYSLLLPDSELDEYYDVKFEFYNNENVASKQVLTVKNLLAEGTPPVITNNIGILMVDPENSTLDGKNMVRTIWENYDTYILHTSSYREQSGVVYQPDGLVPCNGSSEIAQFTSFIPSGAPYITVYYNAAVVNLTKQTNPADIGQYSYDTILTAYTMSTSSYSNFTFSTDAVQTKVVESTASIILSSDMNNNHTAYGYPVRHSIELPETNQLYRFVLRHHISVPDSGSSTNIGFYDFNTPDSWSLSLPGIVSIGGGSASVELNAGDSGYLMQTLTSSLTLGQQYKVSLEVTNYNALGSGDYISLGLDLAPVTNTAVASVSSSNQITNVGTYQYNLTPNASNLDQIYVYFKAAAGSGTTTLNEYTVPGTYTGLIYTTVNRPTPVGIETGDVVTLSETLVTSPLTDLLSTNRITAQTAGTYIFNYNLSVTGSGNTVPASCNGALRPNIKHYNSSNVQQSSTIFSTILFSNANQNVSKSYNGSWTRTMSAGDYLRFEIYYTANNVPPELDMDVIVNGTISLEDPTPSGGSSTFEIRNISLSEISSTSASFETSCSIKDINVLSSGYLFLSGSRPTYISGAYDYYVPTV